MVYVPFTMAMAKERLDIVDNIHKGVYKLIPNSRGRCKAWSILYYILAEDNTTFIKDYVYCTVCKKLVVFKNHVSNLVRHKCCVRLGKTNEPKASDFVIMHVDNDANNDPDNEIMLDANDRQTLIKEEIDYDEDHYGMEQLQNVETILENVKEEEEDIIYEDYGTVSENADGYVTSNNAMELQEEEEDEELATNDPLTLPNNQHKIKNDSNIHKPEEIEQKLKTGRYTVMDVRNNKSKVWNYYSMVINNERGGEPLDKWLCCKQCGKVVQHSVDLFRHACYLQENYKIKFQDEEEEEEKDDMEVEEEDNELQNSDNEFEERSGNADMTS
ncbi:uncharacterized protein [Musca autumnalis]|uniref:uncharacterized protein n=1 Tax=Musca autumnalis TaxID=221902 RepID=UPI003CE9FE77